MPEYWNLDLDNPYGVDEGVALKLSLRSRSISVKGLESNSDFSNVFVDVELGVVGTNTVLGFKNAAGFGRLSLAVEKLWIRDIVMLFRFV